MKNNKYRMNAFLRFSFVVLLFSLITTNASAQLSFISSGQQLNNLAGRGVVLDDFNGDNKLDAFVVNEDGPEGNGYRVYFGDGTGQFTDSDQILHNPYGGAPIPDTFDLNGDDRPEVITGRTIWINDGQGAFSADTGRFPGLQNVEFLNTKFAFINNDSLIDVFAMIAGISNYVGAVFINNGQGKFTDSGQRLANGIQADFNLGNLNSDDFIDAVITGWRNANGDPCPNGIWINDGNGNFTKTSQNIDEGMRHVHASELGDIDNDGDKDLILGIQTNSPYVKVFKNDGTGKFTSHQGCGLHGVEDIKLADMDNDGDPDLVLACNGPNEVWLNDGVGNFNNSNLALGSQWTWGIDVGDFNNDNKTDIFAVNMAFDNLPADPWYIARGRVAEVWLNTTFICDYFGQTPPGDTAEIFAPGIISLDDRDEESIAFSPDGNEVYFMFSGEIYNTKRINNIWEEPVKEPNFSGDGPYSGFLSPTFSRNGKKLYLGKCNWDVPYCEIYFVERTTEDWSEPQILPEPFNSSSLDGFGTETSDGICYIHSSRSGNLDIWRIQPPYQQANNLGPIVNSTSVESSPCVSPDGSYMIFNSDREGKEYLYITFNKGNDEWTIPVNMEKSGAKINLAQKRQTAPSLSPDGKYLFFNRHIGGVDNSGDIYWVSTSIIDDLKEIALSTSVKESERTQIQIFPNPTSQTIQIKGIDMLLNKASYQLTDLNGKTIKQGILKSETIDISELPIGIYVLSLQTNIGIVTEKIVIE